jgi:tyrosyl-tRNA synthetase
LDEKLSSVYEFYQYFINTPDNLIIQWFKYFSFKSMQEIKEIETTHLVAPEKRYAQKLLAQEMTLFVHKEKGLLQAEKITKSLFDNDISNLNKDDFKAMENSLETIRIKNNLKISDILSLSGLSKRQIREDIQNKAISVNGEVIDEDKILKTYIFNKYSLIRRGKKTYFLIVKQ